jgi:hypothetical protein
MMKKQMPLATSAHADAVGQHCKDPDRISGVSVTEVLLSGNRSAQLKPRSRAFSLFSDDQNRFESSGP